MIKPATHEELSTLLLLEAHLHDFLTTMLEGNTSMAQQTAITAKLVELRQTIQQFYPFPPHALKKDNDKPAQS